MGFFEEAQRHADVEPIGPFDRNATVRARQIALIRACERQVIGSEGAGAPSDRAIGLAVGCWHSVDFTSAIPLLARPVSAAIAICGWRQTRRGCVPTRICPAGTRPSQMTLPPQACHS